MSTTIDPTGAVHSAVAAACARVAPVWPLERFVAVNPYVGLTDHTFRDAAALLSHVAGANSTLPVGWYLDAVEQGRIAERDLDEALTVAGSISDVETFLKECRTATVTTTWQVPTVATVATAATGTDWARHSLHRIAGFAAAYFDGGQAIWCSADKSAGVYAAWKADASVDRTPELMGLRGFRSTVKGLPDNHLVATELLLAELGVPTEAIETYVHALLRRVGGWSAHCARLVFEHGLHGEADDTLQQFATVLLAWEVGVLRAVPAAQAAWPQAVATLTDAPAADDDLERRLVLQDAFERAEQRRLVSRLSTAPTVTPIDGRPDAQAIFCIDVRSEVFRRHLEATSPRVQTLGFAGFFGMALDVLPLAHDTNEAQCPVLLTAGNRVAETVGSDELVADAVRARSRTVQGRRAWKSFKGGAISCFSFVSPVGLAYLPKLFTDAAGRTRPVRHPQDDGLPAWARDARRPSIDPVAGAGGVAHAERVRLAEGALRAMSLTSGFAPIVLLTGHGSTTVNNPYATGLDCGACGGHTGEANARVAAAILNDPAVRTDLAARGIVVPADTVFVAAQHDTTTDVVAVFDRETVPTTHVDALIALEATLAEAGRGARAERASRMAIEGDVDTAVMRRSTDWAQVRPEWGLAGCRAFVVAPRHRTASVNLRGRSFLHSYDWQQDESFGVLELIMTAPMVVASWISLQYYGSTVDNELFGSGNKVLHNVVGKLGVLEGNGGDLRTGLPWQSVHDGTQYQHEPLRLNVVIEAPLAAIEGVLRKHPGVRDLCDHGWVHLFAMDAEGTVAHRYAGNFEWASLVDQPLQAEAA
ncbi:MAG: YbcC family protein [Ilumatobacteraceae bacterium]